MRRLDLFAERTNPMYREMLIAIPPWEDFTSARSFIPRPVGARHVNSCTFNYLRIPARLLKCPIRRRAARLIYDVRSEKIHVKSRIDMLVTVRSDWHNSYLCAGQPCCHSSACLSRINFTVLCRSFEQKGSVILKGLFCKLIDRGRHFVNRSSYFDVFCPNFLRVSSRF